MCAALLPPAVNPIAVNKYIMYHLSYRNSSSARQDISRILWTGQFITMLTRACHLYQPLHRSIHSTPCQTVSRRPILIVSYHLRPGLVSGFFPSLFVTKLPLLYIMLHTPHISFFLLWLLVIFGQYYESYSLLTHSTVQSPSWEANWFEAS